MAAVALAWLGHELDNSQLHRYAGYSVLVLVVFRVIWGFVGSTHARFSDFVRGPRAVRRYLQGSPSDTPGHNPLGGWSVLLLLTLLMAQAGTGLFNSDGLLFDGPFHAVFNSDINDLLGATHELLFNVLMTFVSLHIAAVLFYQLRKKQDQLWPMITGRSEQRVATGPAKPTWWALIIVVLLGLLLWYAISHAPQPKTFW